MILYEDDVMLAVDKPSGMLTVPDRWDKKAPNLHGLLEARAKKKIFVVHRLDKDTSGLIVFAKSEECHRRLSLQFETRFVDKEYLALVRGVMADDTGSFTYPMAEDLRRPGTMITHRLGKFAQTDFSVLERFDRFQCTWVLLKPQTGRTHQIRLHLQCAGYPVIGDTMYGAGGSVYLSAMKKKYKTAKGGQEKPLLDRLALHACRLALKHPQTDEPLALEAPLAKDLEITLKYLRKFGR